MSGALVLQGADALAQGHLFEDERVAARCRFHLGSVGSLAGHVLDLAGAGVALTHLLDEVGLALDGLPHAAVQGLLGSVAVDPHLEPFRVAVIELVALADDPAFALLQVGGAPRCIQVMQGHQPILHVHACAHLGGGAEQHAHAAATDFGKQISLLQVRLRVVDEGDLVSRDPTLHQLLFQVVIDGESRVEGVDLVRADLVQLGLGGLGHCRVITLGALDQITQLGGLVGAGTLRGGQVDKHQLGAAVSVPAVVIGLDVVGGVIDLAVRVVRVVRVDQAHIQRSLAGVGHDLEHVVTALLCLLGQVLGAVDKRTLGELVGVVAVGILDGLADVLGLPLGAVHYHVLGLAALHLRHRQAFALGRQQAVDVVAVDDVGEGGVALHQLGHVHELGEPAIHLVLTGRGQLPVGDNLAKHAGPGVEVRQAGGFQVVVIQIALHGIHLGHGVADRRAGREHHIAAPGRFAHDTGFHVEVSRLLAAGRAAQACNVAHAGAVGQVLELVSLVQEQRIDPQVIPVQAVILVAGIEQGFQLLLHLGAALGGLLHVAGLLTLCCLNGIDGGGQVGDLLLDELRFCLRLHAHLAERGVSHDHRVPVTGCDAGEEALAVGFLKVALGCGQHVGAGVQLDEVLRPLSHQMVGDNEHRLAGQAQAAQLHGCGHQREGLAGTDDVIRQGAAALHDAPYRIALVRA